MLHKLSMFFEIITAISICGISLYVYNNKPKNIDYDYNYMKSLSNEDKRKYIDDYEKQFEKYKK